MLVEALKIYFKNTYGQYCMKKMKLWQVQLIFHAESNRKGNCLMHYVLVPNEKINPIPSY